MACKYRSEDQTEVRFGDGKYIYLQAHPSARAHQGRKAVKLSLKEL